MKITLKQWQELAELRKAAAEALTAYDRRLLELAIEYDGLERDLLLRLSTMVEFVGGPEVSPVSEWMGGDSSDPKNYKLREPHICGLSSRRYFTDEEIQGTAHGGP